MDGDLSGYDDAKAVDVFDEIETEMLCENPTKFAGTVGAIGSGTVAAVLRGLKASGMGFLDVLAWLPVVLDLVKTLGPMVEEIIKKIREAIDGGKTPQTFTA